ncbi:conserved hypothetical protein [Echinococcus multilocularis]|uniref:Uncharacterized protein n=1 Tax=Echinococcus multilocularis TaxID=6211 RepID=A0A068YHD7_ECHMU|nr:conserved hypothetical protein [Echinococcus multilocularis]
MGGSASKKCTNFRHIFTTNARVASLELYKPHPAVFLPSLHQDVDETTLLDYAGDEENGSSEIELKEEQVMSSDMQDEQVATRIEINDIVEEVKEDNFREECTPIHLNNSLKATEPAHPHPRFTAFEIPVHTGPCAMLTPMIPRNSPCDTVEAESHRPVETASTVTYSHPKTHSLVHSRRYTPLRGQLRKKSTPPPQRKTLCQKYPQTYRKARESVLPLITDSAPSTQTNDSTSSFRPERSCSLRKLNVSSEWRTNRLAGDTWIHYPNRVSTFQATRRLRLPQNPSTRRLKPIDKSTIPTNPAAGDQTLFPSKPHKPPSPMLPPLSRSAVSRFRPVCNRGGGGWGEVGLGAPNSRNGGSSLPPPTSFSSPRVENPNPFNPFTLQTEGYDNNEELLSRDQIIFRNSKITGETSYFKQYSLDEIHGSTKH